MSQYGTPCEGPYNDPRSKCNHEFQKFSDGYYCRKCYVPMPGQAEYKALKDRVAALEEQVNAQID